MTVSTEAEKFAVIWQTLIAFIIASIAGVLGMVLFGAFIYYSQRFLTDLRPEIIKFDASIASGIAAVFAAREACDKLLKHYSQRAIFGLFVFYGAASIFVEIFLVPPHWGQISVYAQDLTILIGAFFIFWRGEPTGFSN